MRDGSGAGLSRRTTDPVGDAEPVIAAVDFGGTKTAIAIAGLDGTVLGRRLFTTPGGSADSVDDGDTAHDTTNSGAMRAVARAIDVVRRMAGPRPVRGIGVVGPGVIGAHGIRLAPHVSGWDELRLPRSFGAAFPDSVAVFDNDVKAAALAELDSGQLRGIESGILVSLGTGIAVATVVFGRIVRGTHGWAGEVGYTPGTGPHGARASIEELVGGAALRKVAARHGLASTAELIDEGLRDPELGRLVARHFEPLADALASWCLLIDPARIVITGGLLAARALWWQTVLDRINEVVPDPPAVVESAFGADGALGGAVLLARRAIGAPAPAPDLSAV